MYFKFGKQVNNNCKRDQTRSRQGHIRRRDLCTPSTRLSHGRHVAKIDRSKKSRGHKLAYPDKKVEFLY